jgi:hypothetical protein
MQCGVISPYIHEVDRIADLYHTQAYISTCIWDCHVGRDYLVTVLHWKIYFPTANLPDLHHTVFATLSALGKV